MNRMKYINIACSILVMLGIAAIVPAMDVDELEISIAGKEWDEVHAVLREERQRIGEKGEVPVGLIVSMRDLAVRLAQDGVSAPEGTLIGMIISSFLSEDIIKKIESRSDAAALIDIVMVSVADMQWIESIPEYDDRMKQKRELLDNALRVVLAVTERHAALSEKLEAADPTSIVIGPDGLIQVMGKTDELRRIRFGFQQAKNSMLIFLPAVIAETNYEPSSNLRDRLKEADLLSVLFPQQK